MPSLLTRRVFRRLLANEPIIHRGCLRRQSHNSYARHSKLATPLSRNNGLANIQYEQQRNIWNFNIFSKRQDDREADMDPGIDKMMELAKRERMRARMPPLEDVVEAFRSFFRAKYNKKEPIQDNQAVLALQALRYCLDVQEELRDKESVNSDILRDEDMVCAASVLRYHEQDSTSAHVNLASALVNALKSSTDSRPYWLALRAYVKLLCWTGSSSTARDIVLEYEKQRELRPTMSSVYSASEDFDEDAKEDLVPSPVDSANSPGIAILLRQVLEGFARERNEAELRRTSSLLEERQAMNHITATGAMLTYYLTTSNTRAVQHWWKWSREIYIRDKSDKSRTTKMNRLSNHVSQQLLDVLKWCLMHNEIDVGHQIVKEVMGSNPPKSWWDAIFVWAAGTKKSADEIDRMISVMEESNKRLTNSAQWRTADVVTINNLVELAVSQNDPYMAERFVTMGRARGIEPDAKTYVLQMDYRLSVSDVDGALVAYKNLQSMDLSSNEDVPTVNRLLVALCKSGRHDFDTIMNVAADLSDRRVRFEPLTVSSLSLLHLRRGEYHDVVDLLNTHAFHYSSAERGLIRDALISFATDPANSTAQAWETYSILRNTFDELAREDRTELMISFFNRERPDMAVHVFQNMRMHSRADTIPTIDTYVTAFLNSAKLRDLDSLEVIHNLLKLDYNINVSTYLYNALIIAYTACGMPRKALGFWGDIVAGREGPSYNSIHVAFRACEKEPFGDLRAQDIWKMLKKRRVDLDQNLWSSYIAALAGNGDNERSISTVEAAEANGELEVDAFLIGSFFAAAPNQDKQTEIEKWAQEKYPNVWEELERIGEESDENGMRSFKIDRRVTP